MTFSENLMAGLNNPECSFFVGATVGQYLTLRIIFALVGIYIITKILDKLVLNPLLAWIYKKIYGGRKK